MLYVTAVFFSNCQFSVIMKSHTFVPVVAVLVVLVIAVQEVQLVSNWGRRFGRSLDKKYNTEKTHRRQVEFNSKGTIPQIEDEDGGGRPFNEHLPVRWGVTMLTECNFLRVEIFWHKEN